ARGRSGRWSLTSTPTGSRSTPTPHPTRVGRAACCPRWTDPTPATCRQTIATSSRYICGEPTRARALPARELMSWLSQEMLVAVTDHAAERFRQRVRGTLDPKTEVASRVARAAQAGRSEPGDRGTMLVRDLERRDLIYVCRPEAGELIVITLYEQGDGAAVPKRFTDALRRDDKRVA